MKMLTTCTIVLALVGATPLVAQEASSADRRIDAHLDAGGEQAVQGINSFSLDLYKQSISPDRNLLISPASVSIAIGLAYRGARGVTAEELRRVMHYGASPELYLPINAAVLASLNFAGEGREMRSANALWLQQDMPLNAEFTADVIKHARAGIQRVDFRDDPDAARLTINGWVANATNDRIRNLLHPLDVTAKTRAALVNSMYWKGRWAAPFRSVDSKSEPFHMLDGKREPTLLMHQQKKFQVLERNGVKAIQLPYVYGEVSMVVLLPDSSSDILEFGEKLTDAKMRRWLADLDAAPSRDTIVTLPKMHLEWRNDLKTSIEVLGAPTAFSDVADFSGMIAIPYPGEVPGAAGLTIKKIIHQTRLDVDEDGSEAAAATAVLMDVVVTGSRIGPQQPPFVFKADKPFVFLLKDRRTGLILFLGRYVTPASE